MEDTRQLAGADVLLLDVLMMMNVIMLMEARQVAVMMKVKGQVLLEVLVEVLVLEAVLLFSLSPTPLPSTRPAARVWASGAKGSGFPVVLPAPGRRCSGPFSRNTASVLVRHGVS